MSYADMGEIYIDCQPVDGGENEIIKPRNVYKMTPLFDSENMSRSSIYFLSVCFALFLFLISVGIFNVVKTMTSMFNRPSMGSIKFSKYGNYLFQIIFGACLITSFFIACLQLASTVYSTEMKYKIYGYIAVCIYLVFFFIGASGIFSTYSDNDFILKKIDLISVDLFNNSTISIPKRIAYLFVYLIGLCVILYGISIMFISFFLTIENKDQDYYKKLVLFVFFSSPLLMTGLFYSILFLQNSV